jgi:hypothetical protein
MAREIKNHHVVLGHTGHTLSSRGREYTIVRLSTWEYAGAKKNPGLVKVGVSLHAEGKVTIVGLSDTAALELAKGLLQELCKRPICMAADEEFRAVIEGVRGAIKLEDANSEALVRCVRERVVDPRRQTPAGVILDTEERNKTDQDDSSGASEEFQPGGVYGPGYKSEKSQ